MDPYKATWSPGSCVRLENNRLVLEFPWVSLGDFGVGGLDLLILPVEEGLVCPILGFSCKSVGVDRSEEELLDCFGSSMMSKLSWYCGGLCLLETWSCSVDSST